MATEEVASSFWSIVAPYLSEGVLGPRRVVFYALGCLVGMGTFYVLERLMRSASVSGPPPQLIVGQTGARGDVVVERLGPTYKTPHRQTLKARKMPKEESKPEPEEESEEPTK